MDLIQHQDRVRNVSQEHIHLEEQQHHVQIVELVNIVQQEHQVVQHVKQELMDQILKIVDVQIVKVVNIHQLDQVNAVIVLHHVEAIVKQQQENANHVLLDMVFLVEHVQLVDQENIHLEEMEHV